MAKGPNFQSSQRSSVSQPVQLAQKQLIVFFTLLSLPSIAHSFWGVVWDRQLYQFDISPTDDNHVRPCRCSHNVLRHGGRRIVTCSKTREVSIQLLILVYTLLYVGVGDKRAKEKASASVKCSFLSLLYVIMYILVILIINCNT